MKLNICYWRFTGFDGCGFFIGGIETYLLNICRLAIEMGWTATIYQCADRPFRSERDGISVVGVKTPSLRNERRTRNALFRAALAELDVRRDVLLFGGDQWSVPTANPRVLSVQHGILHDLPIEYLTRNALCKCGPGEWLKRWTLRRRYLRNFCRCRNRVCVDYNFVNWYKTYCTLAPKDNVWVIPNFAPIAAESAVAEKLRGDRSPLRVLFARRFEPFRGSRLMVEVAKQLLSASDDTAFTFAGDGTDNDWITAELRAFPRASIRKYAPDAMQQVHLEHDVSVVPSLGSEGTSLSVAEAMGAGCAVVASPVGGVTNMVIDGFNGVLTPPTVPALCRCLRELLDDRGMRVRLAETGYRTAACAFSLEVWKRKWQQVLEHVAIL